MSRLKCVNLGLPKSGTTTLSHALRDAGWRVADHKLRRGLGFDRAVVGQFVGHLMYKGYFHSGNPFEGLGFVEALCEINVLNAKASCWPQCDYPLLKAMRLHGRGVKFVATWRPAEDIADSMMRWTNLGSERLPAAGLPGLPVDFGTTEKELIRWINSHYDMLDDVFGDDPNFMRLDVRPANANAPLSRHLSSDITWWGRMNVNEENPAMGSV